MCSVTHERCRHSEASFGHGLQVQRGGLLRFQGHRLDPHLLFAQQNNKGKTF